MRLGKISQRQAETIKRHVEQLVASIITRTSPPDETSHWLAGVESTLRDRLAAVGLAEKRDRLFLGAYLKDYIASRTDAKPNTLAKWRTTEQLLIDFFGEDAALESITQGDADRWRRRLSTGRAENTVRKHIAVAKVFFNAAVRRRYLPESPFADQKATILPNATRQHYVSPEDAEKVIAACPDAQWRLIFALSRYGGLRCPSETLALKWGDVDWEGRRLRVTASKTERHVGKGHRWLPIFPELALLLETVFDQAEEGTEFVISKYRGDGTNLRTQLTRIVERAGVEVWPKLFQNLRSTRQTELEATFPLHVVCAWLGNSPQVAREFYLQVTDAHFAEAVAPKAAQNAAQHLHAPGSTHSPEPSGNDKKTLVVPLNATPCDSVHAYTLAREGLEPPTKGL